MLNNPALMPGMFARLSLPLGPSRGILIPQEAVATVGQLTMVEVAMDQTAQLRQVKLGRQIGRARWKSWRGLQAGRPDYLAGENRFWQPQASHAGANQNIM